MATAALPESVHLVGSIGLRDSKEVFSTVGKLFGSRLKRVPDGEPGGRAIWVSWQYPVLMANPFLAGTGEIFQAAGVQLIGLANGVRPEDVRFNELGYAREARTSYQDFLAARNRGDIPKTARFQVSMPTPFEVLFVFADRKQIASIEPAYVKAFQGEVREICASIPHEDLCIQWDVCHQMLIWDGQSEYFSYPLWNDVEAEVTKRLQELCEPIPDDVELGFHLCYGDFKAKHFFEPKDSAKLVEAANALSRVIRHKIAYIHMPVPIGRADDAYFAPLANLRLRPETELFLGLVHADGGDGNRARLAAAQKYAKRFGVATECGMARARTTDVVHRMLEAHLHVCRAPHG